MMPKGSLDLVIRTVLDAWVLGGPLLMSDEQLRLDNEKLSARLPPGAGLPNLTRI